MAKRIKSNSKSIERYEYKYKVVKSSRAVAFNFMVTVMAECTRYVFKKHSWFIFDAEGKKKINKCQSQRRNDISKEMRSFLYFFRTQQTTRATDFCNNFSSQAPLLLGECAYSEAWFAPVRLKRPYLDLVKYSL